MLKCYMGVLIHIKTQMIAFPNDLKLFHINTKKSSKQNRQSKYDHKALMMTNNNDTLIILVVV